MDQCKAGMPGQNIRKSFPFLVFAAVYVMFALLRSDKFLTMANMRTIVQQSSVMATVAVGMLFVIILGEIDLSVSAVMGLAGFICADLAQESIPLAIGAGVLTGAAVGAVNGLVFTCLGIPSMIATVGMHMILVGFMRIYSGSRSVRFTDICPVRYGNEVLRKVSQTVSGPGRGSCGGTPDSEVQSLWQILYCRGRRPAAGTAEPDSRKNGPFAGICGIRYLCRCSRDRKRLPDRLCGSGSGY